MHDYINIDIRIRKCEELKVGEMETSIQNYFWIVDRLSMEDDPRNRVNAENETVTLSEDLKKGIEDGQIFGKLLSVMHRTYVMRTNNSFELSA